MSFNSNNSGIFALNISRIKNLSASVIHRKMTKSAGLPAEVAAQRAFSTKVHQIFSKGYNVLLKDFSGKNIPARVVKDTSSSWHMDCNGSCVGDIWVSRTSAPISGDAVTDSYKNNTSLFVNHLSSHRIYKGVGTELLKAAVKESDRLGYKGRDYLNASTTNPQAGSPVPFYYKFGFRSAKKCYNEMIADSIKNCKKIPEECEATTMFLPEDRIKEILGENLARCFKWFTKH
ncbi:MAG: hypothetical protein PHE78_06660 [Candidatus Gastranaerophilales bacterium]|nr:hypothetical protein [Candidatus Gastranaerophilales bacterium]